MIEMVYCEVWLKCDLCGFSMLREEQEGFDTSQRDIHTVYKEHGWKILPGKPAQHACPACVSSGKHKKRCVS